MQAHAARRKSRSIPKPRGKAWRGVLSLSRAPLRARFDQKQNVIFCDRDQTTNRNRAAVSERDD
ncbi:hypothetical protein DOC35_19330 [Salmonella enterica subsp. enterica]|nr:hypothetical protein [Salmonella enterica subsp. enterica]